LQGNDSIAVSVSDPHIDEWKGIDSSRLIIGYGETNLMVHTILYKAGRQKQDRVKNKTMVKIINNLAKINKASQDGGRLFIIINIVVQKIKNLLSIIKILSLLNYPAILL